MYDPNETDEDLDKMIAEQMQCLPDWWLADSLEENPIEPVEIVRLNMNDFFRYRSKYLGSE